MGEQSTESVLKFLKGEISFTEWLEKKEDEIVTAEEVEEQDKDSDVEDEKEPTPSEQRKKLMLQQDLNACYFCCSETRSVLILS